MQQQAMYQQQPMQPMQQQAMYQPQLNPQALPNTIAGGGPGVNMVGRGALAASTDPTPESERTQYKC